MGFTTVSYLDARRYARWYAVCQVMVEDGRGLVEETCAILPVVQIPPHAFFQ